MTFIGFLLFFDPPKPDAQKTITDLKNLGVTLKVITGDNRRVALHVAQTTGMQVTGVVTGAELNQMRDEALWRRADQVNLFAEVDPNQKERIISACARPVTWWATWAMASTMPRPCMPPMWASRSIHAVDVAKEAADFVLLEQNLDVLRQGIEQGRQTFANTLKYVFTTTSANFGNMFSMAGLSLFLPFLPLLPKQILLNNFMSDFPAMTIATDAVDPEMVDKPRRWDVNFIRNFMIVFRPDQLRLRFHHLWGAAAGAAGQRGPVPHRLVYRIVVYRVVHPAGGAHPPAAVQKQAGAMVVDQHPAGRSGCPDPALPARHGAPFRLCAAAAPDDGHCCWSSPGCMWLPTKSRNRKFFRQVDL